MPDFREIIFSFGIDQDATSKIISLLEEASDVKPDISDIAKAAAALQEKLGVNHDESIRLAHSALLKDGDLRVKMMAKLKEAALLLFKAKPSLNRYTAFREVCQAFLKLKESDKEFEFRYAFESDMKYPRDIDLDLLDADKYKGTENYFSCSFVPSYYHHEDPL